MTIPGKIYAGLKEHKDGKKAMEELMAIPIKSTKAHKNRAHRAAVMYQYMGGEALKGQGAVLRGSREPEPAILGRPPRHYEPAS
jgi:hypothetical protein